MTLAASFAKNSLSFIALNQVYAVEIFTGEVEVMGLIDQLDLIRDGMGTQLLRFKKVNIAFVRAHVEVPDTEQLLTNTMHRLISFNNTTACALKAEGVRVRQQTGHS